MRKGWLLSLLASLLILAAPASSFADVSDFTVTNFTADYTLSRSDPQGELVVHETIDVDFTGQNHGILRALPQRYHGQSLHLHINRVQRDGTKEPYTTYTSNGNKVLKIGRADATITGPHTYVVDYTVQNVIRFDSGIDQLIWNTNGTQWDQPFLAVTARLYMPSGGLAAKFSNPACYTGTQGSTEQSCGVTRSDGATIFTTTRTLQAGENMTFAVDFPVGVFAKPTLLDWWKDHAAMVLQLVVPPLAALAFAYPRWRKKGKDIKGRGTIVPEYAPPDGIRAAEADVIDHFKLGKNAISATIIDLAIRKYLRIVEGKSDGVLGIGKHKTYSFEKLPAPANDSLKPYEQSVLSGLFASGDLVKTDDLKNKFYVTAQSVQKSVPEALTTTGYFPANPKKAGAKLVVLATVVFVGAWFLFGFDWALAVGLIIGAAIVMLFAHLMPNRTQKGVDAKDQLAGLKLYMETAEKDRLAMLQSPDAPYAPKSDAPKQTVELFEKLLPYAMVMGVEKQWAKQFENIYTTPPDWYAGNWTAFSTGYLVGSLSESVSAMNTSFAAPSSSGSGGGGGFSGGGGGGGGGGGW